MGAERQSTSEHAGEPHALVMRLDAAGRYLEAWAREPLLLARPAAALLGRTVSEGLGEEGLLLQERVERVAQTGLRSGSTAR